MTDQARAVLEAARKLSPVDQAIIAEALLAGLPAELEEVSEEELVAELQRRDAEMESGADPGIPWKDLRDEK
jgi:putative addiction module component (TIGR02574 family)